MAGAVLLIHGLIGPFTVPGLAEDLGRLVLSPDLAGYGDQAGANEVSLATQAAQVVALIDEAAGPVDVVGHSLGGIVAMLAAEQRPDAVARVISIEGNFTLDDAFWSGSVGRMSADEAEAMLRGYRADPEGWLAKSGLAPTPSNLQWAQTALAFQDSETLRAIGRSVVEITGGEGWEPVLRRVFDRTPVALVAGERSRGGWHVPNWALDGAASHDLVADAGHMMMIERPDAFLALMLRTLRPHPDDAATLSSRPMRSGEQGGEPTSDERRGERNSSGTMSEASLPSRLLPGGDEDSKNERPFPFRLSRLRLRPG